MVVADSENGCCVIHFFFLVYNKKVMFEDYNGWDAFFFLIPMAVGFGASAFCRVGEDAGENVPFRPPSWFFSVIWPVLFLCFGWSWVEARHQQNGKYSHIPYAITTFLLGLWIVVYGCVKDKVGAVWVLVATAAAAFECLLFGDILSRALVFPVIAWILFALFMNTTEVSNTPSVAY